MSKMVNFMFCTWGPQNNLWIFMVSFSYGTCILPQFKKKILTLKKKKKKSIWWKQKEKSHPVHTEATFGWFFLTIMTWGSLGPAKARWFTATELNKRDFAECVRTDRNLCHQCYYLNADRIFRRAGSHELSAAPPTCNLRPQQLHNAQNCWHSLELFPSKCSLICTWPLQVLRPFSEPETCVSTSWKVILPFIALQIFKISMVFTTYYLLTAPQTKLLFV